MDSFQITHLIFGISLLAMFIAGVYYLVNDREHSAFNTPSSAVLFWIFTLIFALTSGLWAVEAGGGVNCKNKAKVMSVPYTYSVSTDCLVKFNGQWIPLDQVVTNKAG